MVGKLGSRIILWYKARNVWGCHLGYRILVTLWQQSLHYSRDLVLSKILQFLHQSFITPHEKSHRKAFCCCWRGLKQLLHDEIHLDTCKIAFITYNHRFYSIYFSYFFSSSCGWHTLELVLHTSDPKQIQDPKRFRHKLVFRIQEFFWNQMFSWTQFFSPPQFF